LSIPTLDDADDKLLGRLVRPAGTDADAPPDCPLVVLLHGLAGHADSVYMHKTALHLLDHGRDVLLMNFRGAGESDRTCLKHHHPGRSDDIRALFEADYPGRDELLRCGAVLVGFSLGGNVLIKFLGEGASPAVRAAMTISAPLDLQATSRYLGRARNLPYRAYLLSKLRYRIRTDPDGLSERDSRRIFWTSSIWEFDRRFTAPRNGYDSVRAYYADNSCADELPNVDVPTAMVYAMDDPFVPSNLYRRFDWDRHRALRPLLTDHGGHVGFNERDGALWHNRCLMRLLEEVGE
jgi:hypothetical protein